VRQLYAAKDWDGMDSTALAHPPIEMTKRQGVFESATVVEP
jgi:hypothetical protein